MTLAFTSLKIWSDVYAMDCATDLIEPVKLGALRISGYEGQTHSFLFWRQLKIGLADS